MADALTAEIERTFASGVRVAATLDVSLAPGAILVLFGPSGAGKTTIIRALAGLERPDRGRIAFAGDLWFDAAAGVNLPPQRRRAGCVFQRVTLFPHLTVAENVAFGLGGADAMSRERRVTEMLDLVGAREQAGRRPRELSGGEAQRVALARALAPSPRLLLLDEPFASLDEPTRRQMRGDLRRVIASAAISAVLVTHDRTEAIALGDLVAVVQGGRVRQVGSVGEVLRKPADADVARTLGVETVVPAVVEGSDHGLLRLRVGDVVLRAVESEPQKAGASVFACIRAEDVGIERASPAGASTRNHITARIAAIDADGPIERVSLDCGFPLAAVITHQAREDLALSVGASVLAAIKATSVHVVPRS